MSLLYPLARPGRRATQMTARARFAALYVVSIGQILQGNKRHKEKKVANFPTLWEYAVVPVVDMKLRTH